MVARRNSLVFPGVVIFSEAKYLETVEVNIDAVNSSFLPSIFSAHFNLNYFLLLLVPPCFSTVGHIDWPCQLGVPHNENTV